MNRVPVSCPLCEGTLVAQSLHCRQCDTTLSGQFALDGGAEFDEAKLPILRRFAQLSTDQLQLLEGFVRCEGRLNRLQEEVGLSYPTLRARLDELLQALGFSPREEKSELLDRRQILAQLREGKITAAEAERLLRGSR